MELGNAIKISQRKLSGLKIKVQQMETEGKIRNLFILILDIPVQADTVKLFFLSPSLTAASQYS